MEILMPIFSKNNKTILFIHIPKSAGSSIERIGRETGWIESFSIKGKALKEVSYCKATFQHLHADVLSVLFDFEAFDSIFTVVRNPFSRFKSEYYWQRSQGITNLEVDEWVNETFNKYSNNPYIYDNHIRPQVEFVPDYKKVEVFKLEEEGVQKAQDIFQRLSPEVSKYNSWKKKFRSNLTKYKHEKRSVKNLDVEAKFQDHYEKIANFYKADFVAFSYET